MRKRLTDEWSIDLDGEYLSRLIDHSLQLVAPGRTIWIAVWNPPADQTPAAILEGIKGELPNPNPVGKVEEWSEDGLEVRYASWYPESGDGRTQHSLYGYTIRRRSYVQSALISDSPNDTDCALSLWRSLHFDPGA